MVALLFVLTIVTLAYLDLHENLSLESVKRLYGLDYLTIFFILVGHQLLEYKDKRAFLVYIIGNVMNVAFGFIICSPVVIGFSFMGIYMMIKTHKKWTRDELNKKH